MGSNTGGISGIVLVIVGSVLAGGLVALATNPRTRSQWWVRWLVVSVLGLLLIGALLWTYMLQP